MPNGKKLPKAESAEPETPPAPPALSLPATLSGDTTEGINIPRPLPQNVPNGPAHAMSAIAASHTPYIVQPKPYTGRFATICPVCVQPHVLTTLNVVTNGGSQTETWLTVKARCPQCKTIHEMQVSRPRPAPMRAIEVSNSEEEALTVRAKKKLLKK